MPRSNHLFDYDWTPLNRNLCSPSSVVDHSRCARTMTNCEYGCKMAACVVKNVRRCSIASNGDERPFAHDLAEPGYCKCWEQSLCCDPLRFILLLFGLFCTGVFNTTWWNYWWRGSWLLSLLERSEQKYIVHSNGIVYWGGRYLPEIMHDPYMHNYTQTD